MEMEMGENGMLSFIDKVTLDVRLAWRQARTMDQAGQGTTLYSR